MKAHAEELLELKAEIAKRDALLASALRLLEQAEYRVDVVGPDERLWWRQVSDLKEALAAQEGDE